MVRPLRLMISVVLGVALPWIPGLWIPGIFVAAIPFPEGIHSDHAELFFRARHDNRFRYLRRPELLAADNLLFP